MKFNKNLESIKTYEAGKPIELVVREFGIDSKDIVKLASNENPLGCSPKVIDAVGAILSKMALYPDDSMIKLKNALSTRFGVENENIIIGSGSDQVIEFLIHAKASSESKILMNSITFAMYEIYAKHVGANVIRTTSQEHDLDEFYKLYKEEKPEIIFICTPNNPTGDALDAQKIYDFLDKIDSNTLVAIDGAYMEYAIAKDSAKEIAVEELIKKYDNVIYLGTFSKAYGLGGMRVGYGVADLKIIQELYKLRPPFNITTLSLEAASVALEDEEFVEKSITLNLEQMKRYEEFAKERKIDIINSYTNFVTLCLNSNQNSTKISNQLLQKGMIVRDLSSYNMNAIRVTVGTHEQNSRFFGLVVQFL
ncbi:MAG: histidinol-phosphate transaminase [Sulfurimonas sp. RIFOXYD12_FULL_33_39]|uniref:histidinol-phosphate transaminase n=1 Tax=unclassified Sulfurimonas TaxID=2623549 RepID=UPI0008B9C584|nr:MULTISPECIES: histidinol-phosphate transaminase [unclassified Sulfurimonas]OHE03999.1 MAG: histidinol-phosphate transaminase [Sulfurimonas sp. RIFCSPLOWO2_12_FULL_34_6]OHE08792.1 MAG: histidinol-phosphate transaminase [Sulfurimonas sp. RIFOXYD12_FULL_33_39]OHE14077.1 MAG: histidinol-phosphate transaminase [Sulfurimonas sp. RIFOXYD2_FULL_34_21]DAB27626.1 MAG TPA: histidinol-phosphate transaminase [Sulfurimonas sp. UBA10385]